MHNRYKRPKLLYFVVFLQNPSVKVFFLLLGLVLYTVEVGTDLYLAYSYYHSDDPVWFALTLGFVILAGMSMSIYSAGKLNCWLGQEDERAFIGCLRVLSIIFLMTPVTW